MPVAAAVARLAGARVVTARPLLNVIPQVARRERADAVANAAGDADAVEIAHDLAEAGRGDEARLEIAYVDDPAPCKPGDETLAPRRAAMIEWWLTELGRQVPAPVRPVRQIGDPASWHGTPAASTCSWSARDAGASCAAPSPPACPGA